MKQLLVPMALLVLCGAVTAKLPPPDAAAKAKAAETAARNAWQAKVDGYQLCKAQDRVAARYAKTAGKEAPATAVPVASVPPCMDPGPFAYNPPQQKPLETSGAHSPSGTAASPPSVKEHSGAMNPAKKP